jgi:hypothetical protein
LEGKVGRLAQRIERVKASRPYQLVKRLVPPDVRGRARLLVTRALR